MNKTTKFVSTAVVSLVLSVWPVPAQQLWQVERLQFDYVNVAASDSLIAIQTHVGRVILRVVDGDSLYATRPSTATFTSIGASVSTVYAARADSLFVIANDGSIDFATMFDDSVSRLYSTRENTILVALSTGAILTFDSEGAVREFDSASTFDKIVKSADKWYGLRDSVLYLRESPGEWNIISTGVGDVASNINSLVALEKRNGTVSVHVRYSNGEDPVSYPVNRFTDVTAVDDEFIYGFTHESLAFTIDPATEEMVEIRDTLNGSLFNVEFPLAAVSINNGNALCVGTNNMVFEINPKTRRFVFANQLSNHRLYFSAVHKVTGKYVASSVAENNYVSSDAALNWKTHRRFSDTVRPDSFVEFYDSGNAAKRLARLDRSLVKYQEYGSEYEHIGGLSGNDFDITDDYIYVLGGTRIRRLTNDGTLTTQIDDTLLFEREFSSSEIMHISEDILLVSGRLKKNDSIRCSAPNSNPALVFYNQETKQSQILDLPGVQGIMIFRIGDTIIALTTGRDQDCRIETFVTLVSTSGVQSGGITPQQEDLFYCGLVSKDRLAIGGNNAIWILHPSKLVLRQIWRGAESEPLHIQSMAVVDDTTLLVTAYQDFFGESNIYRIHVDPISDNPTSVESVNEAPSAWMGNPYPVPVTDMLTIPMEWNQSHSTSARASVYSMQGELMLPQQTILPQGWQSTVSMDVSTLPIGSYVLVVTRNGTTLSKVFVKF